MSTRSDIEVSLGETGERSIAASVLGLVERGVALRPDIAAQMEGSVVISWAEDYDPVRIELGSGAVTVSDDVAPGDSDLHLHGSLPDITALLSVPLIAGLPSPTDPRGRSALASLVDGRVRMRGSRTLGRRLLALLQIEPE